MATPSGEEDDDVYPVHAIDDIAANRVFVSCLMRFNDVLEVQKLFDSFSELINIGDYRKLGGRLKFKKDGKLEIRVPKTFTAEDPAAAFSHDEFPDTDIEDDPIGRQVPKPTEDPSIQPISTDFRHLTARADFPKTFEESVQRELPQLSLHVTSFRDATLVALAWPHTLLDGPAFQAVLQAWSLVLAGRRDEVSPVLGSHEDVLSEAVEEESDQEKLAVEPMRLGMFGTARLVGRFMWDKFSNPGRELRMIYVPKDVFARLYDEARREAVEAASNPQETSFVSEGDVWTAWITLIVTQALANPRPITAVNFFNARYRLPQVKSDGVYFQNMTLLAYMFLSPQLAAGSVGSIALAYRRQLAEQVTQEQALSFVDAVRKDVLAGRKPSLLFGEANALPMLFNNLSKANPISSLDLSPAVVRQGADAKTRSNPLGTMVSYYNQPITKPTAAVDMFYVFGKDHAQNYWLMGNLLPSAWLKVEQELMTM